MSRKISEKARLSQKSLSVIRVNRCLAHQKRRCHCEPARTLVWQSPNFSGRFVRAFVCLPENPRDFHVASLLTIIMREYTTINEKRCQLKAVAIPPVRGKRVDIQPEGRRRCGLGGNRYLVPLDWGIATPVCALVRNDSVYSANSNLSFFWTHLSFSSRRDT